MGRLLHERAIFFRKTAKKFRRTPFGSIPTGPATRLRLRRHTRASVVRGDEEPHGVPNRDTDRHKRGHLHEDHHRAPLIPVVTVRALSLRPSDPSMALLAAYAHFLCGMGSGWRFGVSVHLDDARRFCKTVYRTDMGKFHPESAVTTDSRSPFTKSEARSHGHTPPSIGRVFNCAGSITQCRTRWRFQV